MTTSTQERDGNAYSSQPLRSAEHTRRNVGDDVSATMPSSEPDFASMTERQQVAYLLKVRSAEKPARRGLDKENDENAPPTPSDVLKRGDVLQKPKDKRAKAKDKKARARSPMLRRPLFPAASPVGAPDTEAAAPAAPKPLSREARALRGDEPRPPRAPRPPPIKFVAIESVAADAAVDAARGRPSSTAGPPPCSFCRSDVPSLGDVVWINAYPDNDPTNRARWYVSRVVRVLQRRPNGRGGRLRVRYDLDASFDTLDWPDFANARVEGPRTLDGPLAAVRDREGRCVLSGPHVAAFAPSAEAEAAAAAPGVDALSVRGDDPTDALRQYKELADGLLAGLRGRSCLHKHVFDKASTTLVARDGGGRVVGGATLRLLESGRSVVAEVTTVCVAQREGVARTGVGSRLLDAVERLVRFEAGTRAAFLFAAAENTDAASAFWRKRGLVAGPVADHVARHLVEARAILEYSNVHHVCLRLDDGADLPSDGDSDGEDLGAHALALEDDALLADLGRLDIK